MRKLLKLSKVPHHYTYHSTVFSANLAFTKVRLVNNTGTCIPTQMATNTTEQECHRKVLNNQLLVLYIHAIWDTPLLSDISACYRSIGVDSKSQLLRLLLWFEVNEDTGKVDLDKPVVYRRDNVDFGDKPASVITEVGLG